MELNQSQVVDAEVVESTHDLPHDGQVVEQMHAREIDGDTVVSQADQSQQMTPAQMHDMVVWMKAARDAKGKQCRKKGHKGHVVNPAGNKLERKLERQGGLYGRNSLVYQTFLDMRAQAFKAFKASKQGETV